MSSQSPPLSNANGHISRKKTSSPTKSPLPPGWERVKSDQGAYYYWDKKSGKTSWKFPEEEGMCMHTHGCYNIILLCQCTCIHDHVNIICNWIGTISTWTAVLTNGLHVCVRQSGAVVGEASHKYWKPFSIDSYL